MARPGKHKDKYLKRKNSGITERNKAIRQEKNKKRIAKFAARREAGKSYVYKPNPYKEGTREHMAEAWERAAKNVDRRVEFQKMKSVFAKLNNWYIRELKRNKTGGAENQLPRT